MDGALNENTYIYSILAEKDHFSYLYLDIKNPTLFAYEVQLENGEYVAYDLLELTLNIYDINADSIFNFPGTEIIYQTNNNKHFSFIKSKFNDW